SLAAEQETTKRWSGGSVAGARTDVNGGRGRHALTEAAGRSKGSVPGSLPGPGRLSSPGRLPPQLANHWKYRRDADPCHAFAAAPGQYDQIPLPWRCHEIKKA